MERTSSSRAQLLQGLLGLSDDELIRTLDASALELLSGELDHRPELAILLALGFALPADAGGEPQCLEGDVYVTSQGLCYDTFVAVDPLPMRGRFQLLEDGVTEFGPRDRGYLGGRWWEDLNGNGVQDEGDHFFLCPLIGPGYGPQTA